MKYALLPDSRRPLIWLVCDEDGLPIEYADGSYTQRPPYRYVPSAEEKTLRCEIETQFPEYEIGGISPIPNRGRFEARLRP